MDSAQGEEQVKQEEKMEMEEKVNEKPPPPTLPPAPPVPVQEKVEKAPKGQARGQNRAAPSSVVTPASGPSQSATLPQYHIAPTIQGSASKYAQLLALIDEMGKDIRPTYTGNRNCAERLKKEITHARVLVRECLLEVEKNARSQQ